MVCENLRIQEPHLSLDTLDKPKSMRFSKYGTCAPGLTCLGKHLKTEFVAETLLPTNDGNFRVRAYRSHGTLRESEPIALVVGNLSGRKKVAVRVHDQCFTSEVFGSLKCDCREQLEYAKQYIKKHEGVLIYMPQEGRGIGLANKIKAYSMQEKGLDTVDANRVLGYQDDYRSYEPVQVILQDLGIKSIHLMTNNPRKIRLLSQLSIHVEGRIPVIISAGKYSKEYLVAKSMRMFHLLPMECMDSEGDTVSTDDSLDEEEIALSL